MLAEGNLDLIAGDIGASSLFLPVNLKDFAEHLEITAEWLRSLGL